MPAPKGAAPFAVSLLPPESAASLHLTVSESKNLSYTIHQMSFHPNTLHHPTSVGCTSRQWSAFSHETEGSDCAAMSPTGGHCERHWGWGRLKDTSASSPDGLSEACQMAVTATCPSLRTVTMYKQTITLICECTALCVCVPNVCVQGHDCIESTEWTRYNRRVAHYHK